MGNITLLPQEIIDLLPTFNHLLTLDDIFHVSSYYSIHPERGNNCSLSGSSQDFYPFTLFHSAMGVEDTLL